MFTTNMTWKRREKGRTSKSAYSKMRSKTLGWNIFNSLTQGIHVYQRVDRESFPIHGMSIWIITERDFLPCQSSPQKKWIFVISELKEEKTLNLFFYALPSWTINPLNPRSIQTCDRTKNFCYLILNPFAGIHFSILSILNFFDPFQSLSALRKAFPLHF